MSDIDITITSTIVGSILAALGIIQNDVYMLMAAIIISPIGFVLNDMSKDIINHRVNRSAINAAILIFIIMCAILVGFIFAKTGPTLSDDAIRRFSNTNVAYNGLIGLMLGMYTAYITSVKDPGSIELPLVGVAIAITLLPPLVDVGLRYGQSGLSQDMIPKDIKIVALNAISFLFGAAGVNYMMSQK